MSTSSNIPSHSETISRCIFGSTAAPAATVTSTTIWDCWNLTSHTSEPCYLIDVTIITVDAFVNDCGSYGFCSMTVYPNPDISGRGVLTAFLVSAYLVLALILWAYWFGALPEGIVRRLDLRLFFARRERPDNRWREIIVELVLLLSDQQLLTGLAILVAGYTQALGQNLSVYHWNNVIYLAWLSSTVHLMSLSVLRDRLKKGVALRAIRVAAMIFILGLLLAALVPTTTGQWQSQSDPKPGMPVRCLWDIHLYGVSGEGDFWISYVSLLGAFIWKISQFFDSSREWMRFWGRARLECFLEKTARRILQKPPRLLTRAKFKMLTIAYVILVAYMELLECFMLTVFLLAFTLAWGTYKLFYISPGAEIPEEIRSAEREMGFGQLLPILLLSQPVFVAVQMYLEPRRMPRRQLPVANIPGNSTLSPHPVSATLAEAFQMNSRLLSSSEKVAGRLEDPIIDHLYRSKTFVSFLVWICLTFTIPVVLSFAVYDPYPRSMCIVVSIPAIVLNSLAAFPMLFLPWSKRLR